MHNPSGDRRATQTVKNFCPNCGKQNAKKGNFCTKCGTSMKYDVDSMPKPELKKLDSGKEVEHEDNHDDDYDPKAECCICMSAPPDSVFVPCGHSCTCLDCGKKCKECPVCRRKPD